MGATMKHNAIKKSALIVTLAIIFAFFSTVPVLAWTFTADFEDGTPGSRAYGSSGFNGAETGARTYFSSERAHRGSKSALFSWLAGDSGYLNCNGQVNYPSELKEGDEVWIRAYYYFENGWQWSNMGTKIIRHHNSTYSGSN
jgi:hypothetical protein